MYKFCIQLCMADYVSPMLSEGLRVRANVVSEGHPRSRVGISVTSARKVLCLIKLIYISRQLLEKRQMEYNCDWVGFADRFIGCIAGSACRDSIN